MVQFWLDNILDLFSPDNLNFFNKSDDNYIKVLNLIALISIITGICISIVKKDPKYFGISVIVLSVTILFNNTLSKFSQVENIDVLTNAFDTQIKLRRPVVNKNGIYNNKLYVSHSLNLNKGDVIAIESTGMPTETHIISDILSQIVICRYYLKNKNEGFQLIDSQL